ncbi:MAG: LPS sulfotransferase NodH [Oleiphilaceae bacterium]
MCEWRKGVAILYNINSPIIILSAPRAGSTLLFEALSRHPQLWTIGGESHAVIEHVPELSTVARGYVSNRLTSDDASDDVCNTLKQRFIANARSAIGSRLPYEGLSHLRFLEKTPKNALRVDFLHSVFPDAKFIYLVRDPRPNISSIMQAWQSRRFVTYPDLPGWPGGWSLLLPDGWKNYQGNPLAKIAAFQWQAANSAIRQSLSKLNDDQYCTVNYDSFVEDPSAVLKSILTFAGLDLAPIGKLVQNNALPLSKHTLTPPDTQKWRINAKEILPQMDNLRDTIKDINEHLAQTDTLAL